MLYNAPLIHQAKMKASNLSCNNCLSSCIYYA